MVKMTYFHQLFRTIDGVLCPFPPLWMDGWMDLLVGTGVSTALENVQWPKPKYGFMGFGAKSELDGVEWIPFTVLKLLRQLKNMRLLHN